MTIGPFGTHRPDESTSTDSIDSPFGHSFFFGFDFLELVCLVVIYIHKDHSSIGKYVSTPFVSY